jgi:hypothetical protein
MEILKEHKLFRNQLICGALILLISGLVSGIIELIIFGFIYGLIALYNVFSYRKNLKDYKKLKGSD